MKSINDDALELPQSQIHGIYTKLTKEDKEKCVDI